jgi:hypothetical protein
MVSGGSVPQQQPEEELGDHPSFGNLISDFIV